MHELGIVYQILKTVDDVKKQQNLSAVDTVILQIGEMTDIVPHLVEEAWKAACNETEYSNTKLDTEIVPARAKCLDCNYEDDVRNLGLHCPKCSSSNFKIISGREFMIKEITAK